MWIAQDESGKLYVHRYKPQKLESAWYAEYGSYFEIEPSLFQNVKWTDTDAVEVELILKNSNINIE